MKNHDDAVKVDVKTPCWDVMKTSMAVSVYAEHELEKWYHVYTDRLGYVDHTKNTTLGVV